MTATSVRGLCERTFVVTHPPTELAEALRLAGEGLTAAEIARRTGVARRTVNDWMLGRVPSQASWRSTTGPCPTCGRATHDFDALPAKYAYLLGLYLGDGCISVHARRVYRLRITLDAAYPGIIAEASAAMRAVLPANKVGLLARRYGDVQVSSYSRAWPCLLPQHGQGKKHLRPIGLEAWQEGIVNRFPQLLLRGLIHSDGCRFENTGRRWRHPRYCFHNHSDDIRRIFSEACDRLDLRWTTTRRTVYVSRKADVATLDEFVGPKR